MQIFTKKLYEGFKRSFNWSSHETKRAKVIEQGKNIYELLNASLQGVQRLFALAYFVAAPENNDPADDTAGIKTIKSIFFQEEKLKISTY